MLDFTFADENVTVWIDHSSRHDGHRGGCVNFLTQFQDAETLAEHDLAIGDEDERTISIADLEKEWRSPYGDRRQELVFIGQDLPKGEMLAALKGCLLDDEEMAIDVDQWKTRFWDPFASWTFTEQEDHEHTH